MLAQGSLGFSMDNLKAIIESLLFAADAPLSVDKIRSILETNDALAIRSALTGLGQEYDAQKRGFFLKEVAGGYQLRTRPEHREWVRRMRQARPARLSRAAMETLAIIAYKQPILRSDVEHLRGVDCGGVLRSLLEREIIRVLGRKDLPGRPLVYGTTKRFLEMFDLKDLSDLPTLEDLQELGEAWPTDST
jgi:segregation and condensation protein B